MTLSASPSTTRRSAAQRGYRLVQMSGPHGTRYGLIDIETDSISFGWSYSLGVPAASLDEINHFLES